jgi:hypothetical protein
MRTRCSRLTPLRRAGGFAATCPARFARDHHEHGSGVPWLQAKRHPAPCVSFSACAPVGSPPTHSTFPGWHKALARWCCSRPTLLGRAGGSAATSQARFARIRTRTRQQHRRVGTRGEDCRRQRAARDERERASQSAVATGKTSLQKLPPGSGDSSHGGHRVHGVKRAGCIGTEI